jgi:hypothetical protein
MTSVGERRAFGRAIKAMVVVGLVMLATVVVDLAPTSAGVARAAGATCPSGLSARREARTLSSADWNRFVTAIRALQQRGTYDALVNRQPGCTPGLELSRVVGVEQVLRAST